MPLDKSQLRTNREIETAAIAWVIDYERGIGRTAVDVRGRGEPADIRSTDRLIEVKAFGGTGRGEGLWLEPRQMAEATSNPNFHLYLVVNVRQGDPTAFRLVDLHGEQLRGLLARAKEQRYFSVPMPVAIYDATIDQHLRD